MKKPTPEQIEDTSYKPSMGPMPEAKWHPYCDDAPDESDPRADKLGIISLIIETLLEARRKSEPEKLVLARLEALLC